MKVTILACIFTGMTAAAALADGPGKPGTFDQCIQGDCTKPKLYFCQPLSKWVTLRERLSPDCRNHEREQEPQEQTREICE